jgi:hypothetical protein
MRFLTAATAVISERMAACFFERRLIGARSAAIVASITALMSKPAPMPAPTADVMFDI